MLYLLDTSRINCLNAFDFRPDEIADKIKLGLEGNNETIEHAQQWFEIINQSSPKEASDRIWEAIELIAD